MLPLHGYKCLLLWPPLSDANACQRLHHHLCSTGNDVTSMVVMNADCPRTVQTPANKDATFVSVEQEPLKSLRDIARVFPKYFLTINLYGYNFVNVSCINVLWICYGYTIFMWIDESVFCMSVCPTVISQRGMYPIREHSFNVNVWAGIIMDIVLGPLCYQTHRH